MISMEARELRLGNLFYPINRNSNIHLPVETPFVIKRISEFGVKAHNAQFKSHEVEQYFDFDISDLQGIPLTEDWLERFGFKHSGSGFYDLVNKDISLCNIGNEFFHPGLKGKSIDVKIKHVHQLQNLFHALTGEELTLKTE